MDPNLGPDRLRTFPRAGPHPASTSDPSRRFGSRTPDPRTSRGSGEHQGSEEHQGIRGAPGPDFGSLPSIRILYTGSEDVQGIRGSLGAGSRGGVGAGTGAREFIPVGGPS
ncbi:hypothetical protein GCM10022236_05830 [Microlunatus ginsengisoli]|uniref:Uncharacterized protein n=1 Tax=Microlunatus ginsengisoli TaxID=363863 RepID=A0ABP6ZE74_9ACTN